MINREKGYSYYLLFLLSGITFLFFLGFPFENHNESYAWLSEFRHMEWSDFMVKPFRPVFTFRPLGTSTAYLTFIITKGIWLQQLLNWVCTLTALTILFFSAQSNSFFSIIAFIVTSVFFSGYIFLFHLHGVFYGPLLIYISILLAISNKRLTNRQLALLFILSILTALFHTFSLFVYSFFLIAYFLKYRKRSGGIFIILLFYFIFSIILLLVLNRPGVNVSFRERLLGALTSFRTVEVNFLLSGFAMVLTGFSIWMTFGLKMVRNIILLVAVLLFFILKHFGLPVLLLWITVIMLKSMMERQWILLSILISTLFLPFASGTGSPTYTVFVLLVSAFAMSSRKSKFYLEQCLRRNYWLPGLSILCLILTFCLIKFECKPIVIANYFNPILAEKEKTHQLKTIIKWYHSINYSRPSLYLFESADPPSRAVNAINRKHRPPTSQKYLDLFLEQLDKGNSLSTNNIEGLVITFGNQRLPGKQAVFSVPGNYSGPAIVYK